LKKTFLFFLMITLCGCSGVGYEPLTETSGFESPVATQTIPFATQTTIPITLPLTATPTTTVEPTPQSVFPIFAHIAIVILENKEFGTVVGSNQMPNFNSYASENTLLTQYYAPTHPSLPNYLALIGGDTFGINTDCIHCYVDAQSLPDLLEAANKTWKTYQERMPEPCYLGDGYQYAQKHNPFIYFTPIRENQERCVKSIVPLTQLDVDIATGSMPDFIFISPDLCNSGHDCPLNVVDDWLGGIVPKLRTSLDATNQPYLIVLTFDEGQGNHGCCGLPDPAGGRVATVLISPQVKSGFQDDTPYTHYSLLKTILAVWNLPALGKTADPNNIQITAPWK